MGTADVIPGVSGGTLALMLNIYERLIDAIKSVSPATVLPLFKNLLLHKKSHRAGFVEALKGLDAFFLIPLGLGILTAVLTVSSIIPYLIFNHTILTFACFLGLIVPSISIPWKMMKQKKLAQYGALLFGLVLTVGLTWWVKHSGHEAVSPTEFSTTALIMFGSAVIAISAMILPGISGSFLLLLMGQYVVVTGLLSKIKADVFHRELTAAKAAALEHVAHFSTGEAIALIGIFMSGCVVGILVMSRVIHFALAKAHDTTMASLTGMICSSIYVLWPFKDLSQKSLENKHWLQKASNIIPEASSQTWIALSIFAASMIFSAAVIHYGNKKDSETEVQLEVNV